MILIKYFAGVSVFSFFPFVFFFWLADGHPRDKIIIYEYGCYLFGLGPQGKYGISVLFGMFKC